MLRSILFGVLCPLLVCGALAVLKLSIWPWETFLPYLSAVIAGMVAVAAMVEERDVGRSVWAGQVTWSVALILLGLGISAHLFSWMNGISWVLWPGLGLFSAAFACTFVPELRPRQAPVDEDSSPRPHRHYMDE